jgi:hypothetical protein
MTCSCASFSGTVSLTHALRKTGLAQNAMADVGSPDTLPAVVGAGVRHLKKPQLSASPARLRTMYVAAGRRVACDAGVAVDPFPCVRLRCASLAFIGGRAPLRRFIRIFLIAVHLSLWRRCTAAGLRASRCRRLVARADFPPFSYRGSCRAAQLAGAPAALTLRKNWCTRQWLSRPCPSAVAQRLPCRRRRRHTRSRSCSTTSPRSPRRSSTSACARRTRSHSIAASTCASSGAECACDAHGDGCSRRSSVMLLCVCVARARVRACVCVCMYMCGCRCVSLQRKAAEHSRPHSRPGVQQVSIRAGAHVGIRQGTRRRVCVQGLWTAGRCRGRGCVCRTVMA